MGKHSRQERAAQIVADRVAEEVARHGRATRLAEGLQRAKEMLQQREKDGR